MYKDGRILNLWFLNDYCEYGKNVNKETL